MKELLICNLNPGGPFGGSATQYFVGELDIEFNASNANEVFIELSNSVGEKVVMVYNISKKTFDMDRANSGNTSFNKDFAAKTVAPTSAGKRHSLSLFVDKCSIEVFGDNGRFAMTNLVFPTEPYNEITFYVNKGKCKVTSFASYTIK